MIFKFLNLDFIDINDIFILWDENANIFMQGTYCMNNKEFTLVISEFKILLFLYYH